MSLLFPFMAFVSLLLFVASVVWGPMIAQEAWRWLKGSRTTYFFLERNSAGKEIESSKASFGTQNERKYAVDVARDSVIEISWGPFRRRSAIYGNAARYWKITGGAEFSLPGIVCLENKAGTMVEKAIKLINTYQSLGEMLDRIAELESNCKSSEAKFQMVYTAVVALREQILSDKQRYRGVVAQELRHDLETVINEIGLSVSSEDERLKVWGRHFHQNRIDRDQRSA